MTDAFGAKGFKDQEFMGFIRAYTITILPSDAR